MLRDVYDQLFAYCQADDFAGYDPFDGLNSKIFRVLPLKYFSAGRMAWLQAVKRSPTNIRKILMIEKGVNSKGIALFALAELSRQRAAPDEEHSRNARYLLDKLLDQRLRFPDDQPSKTAFGYNFDWQSRAFFAPRGTPTIVPTAFAAQAFVEAYKLFGDQIYLEHATGICRFITGHLNRMDETADEVSFSYTPLDRSVIFNASLLAAECLAAVGVLTDNTEYLNLAVKAANYVLRRQASDGSWAYGSKLRHQWVDNFHTAYILLSLYRLQKTIPGLSEAAAGPLASGYRFWVDNFFLEDGMPKYFDRETYPVDIHSAAAAISALCDLKDFDPGALPLAGKVASWTIKNMRDPAGFFYYQKRRSGLVKIPYIRWANAWTAYAVARLLEEDRGA